MTEVIECAFTGSVGRDPQIRPSKSGRPWLALSIVVGSGDEAQWVQVAVFGELAESGKFDKGTRVYIEGRLRLSTWSGKDGQERVGLNVVATHVQALGQIGQKRALVKKTAASASPVGQLRDWQAPLSDSSSMVAEIPF